MKTKTLSGILLLTLLLVGCGKKGDSSSSFNNDSNSSTSGGYAWSESVKSNMTAYIGEVLPEGSFDSNITFEDLSDEENKYFDIVFDTDVDYLSSYTEILTNNGWTIDYENKAEEGYKVDAEGNVLEDKSTCIYYQLTKESKILVLSVSSDTLASYDESQGEYYLLAEAGNEILGYDNALSGSLTSWPTEEISAVVESEVPSIEGVTYEFYDLSSLGYGYFIVVYTRELALDTSYKAILEEKGWTVEEEASDGIYSAINSDETISLQFYYDDWSLTISISLVAKPVAWPSEDIISLLGVDVPSIPEYEEYYLDKSYLSSYNVLLISVDGASESTLAAYRSELEGKNYVVTYVPSDTSSGIDTGNYYEATNSEYPQVGLIYYLDDSTAMMTIQLSLNPIAASWPSELLTEYFGSEVTIPSYTGIDSYYTTEEYWSEYNCITIYFDPSEYGATVQAYEEILKASGFVETTLEGDKIWTDVNKIVSVDVYIDTNGYFTIDIYKYLGEDEPIVIEDNELVFLDESLLTIKDGQESVWENGEYKLVVKKGTSAQNVGNNEFFSNPLRLYSGQIATLTWGSKTVSSINIEVTLDNKSKMENAAVTGGEVTISGNILTITPNTGVSEITLTMSGQFRITKITFNA